MKKRLLVKVVFFLLQVPVMAQQLTEGLTANSISLTDATISYDPGDALVVARVAGMLADDVERVSGQRPLLNNSHSRQRVIIGTMDGSGLISRIAGRGLLNLEPLRGRWECYLMTVVVNPMEGVDKALVVVGSDRRGAAYGALRLSELIGVSPWYWWADVPVPRRDHLFVEASQIVSREPSVRYRGIFINDEDWGLKPWAANNFESERGNIGPRTYAKVCELLLRLKANYLCPAMHEVSTAFNQIPENKLVADSFAIVMGSTHCEPLLLNTATEWDKKKFGPWDYDINKEKIVQVLEQRVRNNAPYENVWSLALRGLHDAAMGVGVPMKQKVKLLQEALMDQRSLLERNVSAPIEKIPQAFTPYKEVLDIYSNGLELPDDITIVWPDDNFGYMKRLSSPTEQKRSGRAGVYYHVSYLGVPHSYLWFSTTPIALMYEELRKAYDTTADRLWLVNCGDIKGCEPQLSFFLDFAYDIDKFTPKSAADYQARWLTGLFGGRYLGEMTRLTTGLSKLAFARKPEYMGWGYWNNAWNIGGEVRTDTEFSFENYNEAQRRLSEYDQLALMAEQLLQEASAEEYATMFELVYYPAKGAQLMNRMNMMGQLYRKYVRQQRAECNGLKRRVEEIHDSLILITEQYNSLLGGKWRGMMSLRQNYNGSSSYFLLPQMEEEYQHVAGISMGIEAEGQTLQCGQGAVSILPTFNSYAHSSRWIEVFSRGTRPLEWHAKVSQPWVRLSQTKGTTSSTQRLSVSIDWDKLPKGGETHSCVVTFSAGRQEEQVMVQVFRPKVELPVDAYIEANGYIAIPATGFHRKKETPDVNFRILPGLGYEGEVLQMGSPLAGTQKYRSKQCPRVEYDFYTFNAGVVDVYTYVLPTFPLHAERDFQMPEHTNSDTKYSICIDEGSIATPTTSAIEFSQAWYESVLRNCRVNKSTLYVARPGRHTLQLRCGDPGIMVQKIVIDMGGMQRSYQGPPCMSSDM